MTIFENPRGVVLPLRLAVMKLRGRPAARVYCSSSRRLIRRSAIGMSTSRQIALKPT